MMFKSVIVATDLSQEALSVVKNMENLKRFGVEKCLLLQSLIEGGGDSPTESNITTIEMVLKAKQQILEEQGIKVETRVVRGLNAAEISRISEEENYPLIVVGAKTRNLISEALLGEAAYNIIHNCRKPILVVRLQDMEEDGLTVPRPVRNDYAKHILFPTDFSATADQAFEVLKGLVSRDVKKVTLMHVQDQTLLSPYLIARLSEFNETDDERLNKMKKTLSAIADIEIDKLITFGNPSRDILKTVKDIDVQLVVMGSQGKGFVHDFFIGSVGHNLARQSESSVLLIPANINKETIYADK
jgi:nucleotide-binding universal stress UspA family protein